MDFGIGTVVAITVICYLVGLALKVIPVDCNRLIPVVCGIVGGALGYTGFIMEMPNFPAADPMTAVAVGIASGLAATGVNQIAKQLKAGDQK